MKLTIVNTHDIIGGAERCSYDLASEYHKQGHNVSLIVGRKLGSDSFVRQVHYTYFDYKFRQFLFWKLGLTDSLLVAPIYDCFIRQDLRRADVFNIHNMHGSYWNFFTLPIVARRAPVVLTLHDQWFMTGDCAYTYDCTRWTKNCGNCPQASMTRFEDRYAIGGRDTTRINLALKRLSTWAVPAPRMAVVCPSRWLLKCAQQARHLKRYEFHHIEYGIDLDVYHPLNKTECRKEFVLPLAKRLIFTAAVNLHDRRKNFGVVDEFLRSGSWPRDAILVVAGRLRDEEKRTYEGLPVVFLGYLQDRERMAKALSACDCSLVLSRADNLPYTCLEALGCGCPVIGSNVGGIPEIVEDGVTGLVLPSSCSPADLGKAIHSVCGNPMPWLSEMSHRAREKAERCYGLARSVERYTRLFEKMVARCE